MEYQINMIPFEMNKLPEQLFNSEFLSDITFSIEEHPPIYAHSLELMKRSSVFQEQLQTRHGEKLILITGYRYDTFYQFIRYIYTDECVLVHDNCMELFKLAKTYNVIRLQNFITSEVDHFQLFKLYGLPSSEINSVYAKNCMPFYLSSYIDESLSFNEELLEEVLKLDHVYDVNEPTMLNALVCWMNQQCESNEIPLSNRRQQFDKLIRLIRFPTMTDDALRQTRIEHPDLLTRNDYANIAEQKIFGAECKGDVWNAITRKKLEIPYEETWYSTDTKFETKFSVLTDMLLLVGFVQVTCFGTKEMSVQISGHNNTTKEITSLNFITPGDGIVNLGRTIRLLPNHTYSISYQYESNKNEKIEIHQRKPGDNLIVHDPTNSVKILQTDEAMVEIFFKKLS